ncbi:hypothetical protein ACODNH_14930 [Haloarcula sp. NS06]|uniref:hypothetical protein n=1 Tax=Haloarcula sp. NS06 TaxID=3409688 RepID=UPI003DA766F7
MIPICDFDDSPGKHVPRAELARVRREFDLTEGRGVVGDKREVVAGVDGDDGDTVVQFEVTERPAGVGPLRCRFRCSWGRVRVNQQVVERRIVDAELRDPEPRGDRRERLDLGRLDGHRRVGSSETVDDL